MVYAALGIFGIGLALGALPLPRWAPWLFPLLIVGWFGYALIHEAFLRPESEENQTALAALTFAVVLALGTAGVAAGRGLRK